MPLFLSSTYAHAPYERLKKKIHGKRHTVTLFHHFIKKCVSSCSFFFQKKKKNCQHEYQSFTVDVSSVVGAPWECGALTTHGGMAGVGLGELLGESMIQLLEWGVEAPRGASASSPVKTEPPQIGLLSLLFEALLSRACMSTTDVFQLCARVAHLG